MMCGKTLAGFFSQPLHGDTVGQSQPVTGALTNLYFKCSFQGRLEKKESLKCYYMENITNSLKVELVSRVPTEKHFTDNWAFVDLCYLIYE